jgi:hypothetical protein
VTKHHPHVTATATTVVRLNTNYQQYSGSLNSGQVAKTSKDTVGKNYQKETQNL